MLVGLVDGLGGEMELRGFTVANFFENPEFLYSYTCLPKKYTSWTTLLMKQLNLPPLPTLTLYHRHTQPGSCLLTDVSEAAEHDDDLCCAGRGCRGGRGVKDWRS